MTKYIWRTEQIFLTSQSYSEETQTLIMEPDCKRLQRLSCLWFCVRWRHQDFTILHFQKSGSRQPPPPHMHPLPIDPLWLLEYKLWHDSEHGLWVQVYQITFSLDLVGKVSRKMSSLQTSPIFFLPRHFSLKKKKTIVFTLISNKKKVSEFMTKILARTAVHRVESGQILRL